MKDVNGEYRAAIRDRMQYISTLRNTVSKAVHFLDLNKVMEKDALLAIHELAGPVSGGEPAPPITITIIL